MKTKLLLCSLALAGLQAMSSVSAASCQAGFTFTVNGTTATFANTSTGMGSSPNYYWSFGDGTGSTITNPVHTYSYNGTYTVCLYIDSSSTQCNNNLNFCNTVVITGGINPPPTCHDSLNVSSTNASCSTCADGSATAFVSGGTAPYIYIWSTGATTRTITGLGAGTYNVSVTDASGCHVQGWVYVNYPAPLCHANFTYTVNGGTATFTNTSTGITSNFWDFGDGTHSNLQNPTHVYTYNGYYTVCLVGDSSCSYCDSSIVITGAVNPQCSVSFQLVKDSIWGTPLYSWYAYPNVTGTAPFTYLWSFGDGTTSTQLYTSHTYSVAGHYNNICLTITDATGCSSSTCDSAVTPTSGGLIQYLNVVNPNPTTGIQENSLSVNSVFPNPANDLLEISFSQSVEGELQIIDITGREVHSEKINASNVKVNVSNLPVGYYNLSIVSGTKTIHSKIMIAR